MTYTNKILAKTAKCALGLCLVLSLQACNALSRLSEVGRAPEISHIENPTQKAGYRPIEMPMPTAEVPQITANSLWRTGARGFFKDQRAAKVGDILTVKVTINDDAVLENKSEQIRGADSDKLGIAALGGLEGYASKFLPEAVNPANLVDVTSSRNIVGDGTIDRKEEINVTVAAVVTQILPNGNLVVHGTQEIRVNYELRQLQISGIIRRADIGSDNAVASNKIAELRVAYGGRGTISDVQQPRYGRQLLDIVMPF